MGAREDYVVEFYAQKNWGAGFRVVDKAHPNGHNGFDIKNHPQGTWIPALLAGEVVYKGYDSVYGNVTTVRSRLSDGSLVYLYYCHKVNDAGPKVGESVDFGEGIGPVGTTGVSSGPHLHLGASTSADRPILYKGLIDPQPFIVSALARAAGLDPEPFPTKPSTPEAPIERKNEMDRILLLIQTPQKGNPKASDWWVQNLADHTYYHVQTITQLNYLRALGIREVAGQQAPEVLAGFTRI